MPWTKVNNLQNYNMDPVPLWISERFTWIFEKLRGSGQYKLEGDEKQNIYHIHEIEKKLVQLDHELSLLTRRSHKQIIFEQSKILRRDIILSHLSRESKNTVRNKKNFNKKMMKTEEFTEWLFQIQRPYKKQHTNQITVLRNRGNDWQTTSKVEPKKPEKINNEPAFGKNKMKKTKSLTG